MNTARSFLIMLCLLCLTACSAKASDKDDALLMKRVFAYAATMDTMKFAPNELYSYMKFDIKTRRRNAILMAVPSMLAVARGGKREYVGESYAKMVFRSMSDMDVTNILSRSTIPHSRKIMPTMLKYLIPDIYGELLIDKNILSPFYRRNRRYYRYRVRNNGDGTAHISFRPKLDNTRLVKGTATVDVAAGRIISMFVEGEYDMVKFTMDINMGERGRQDAHTREMRTERKVQVPGQRHIGGLHVDARSAATHHRLGGEQERHSTAKPHTTCGADAS